MDRSRAETAATGRPLTGSLTGKHCLPSPRRVRPASWENVPTCNRKKDFTVIMALTRGNWLKWLPQSTTYTTKVRPVSRSCPGHICNGSVFLSAYVRRLAEHHSTPLKWSRSLFCSNRHRDVHSSRPKSQQIRGGKRALGVSGSD